MDHGGIAMDHVGITVDHGVAAQSGVGGWGTRVCVCMCVGGGAAQGFRGRGLGYQVVCGGGVEGGSEE